MNILFITGNYLPQKNGGIENYTHWTAKLLASEGYEVSVGLLGADTPDEYEYEGIQVYNLRESMEKFEWLLQEKHFNTCHFQEYSEFGGIELPWFTTAKKYCRNVFFTFNLPYLTCYKNDFRFNGTEDCRVFTDVQRCTSCVINSKVGGSAVTGGIKQWLVHMILGIGGQKKQLSHRIAAKHALLKELLMVCDKVFVYAGWFKELLELNGYNMPSITSLPYKTRTATGNKTTTQRSIQYKLLFVGRIQHQKGLHLLCEAMNGIKTTNLDLDVYGNIVDQTYFDNCRRLYPFNFKGTTTHQVLLELLKEYDFLVLPSVFTEMYSLIIKDAFYESLPVIGSMAKGNAAAINDGRSGFLFKYDNAADLADTIDRAYTALQEGWQPVFDTDNDIADDLETIRSYYH